MSPQRSSPRRVFNERFRLAQLLAGLAVCATSVVLAYWLRTLAPAALLAPIRHDLWLYVRAVPAVAALWIVAFYSLGLYETRRYASPFAEMTAVFRAVTLSVLLVAAASFLSHTDYSRAMLFLFWGCALVLSLIAHALLREYAQAVRARGEAQARTLVIGCGDLGRLVAQRIRSYDLLGYELVGFVWAFEACESVAGYPVIGRIDELARLVAEYDVDEVLVARPDIDLNQLMTAVEQCEGYPVEFHLVAGPLQVLTEQAEVSGLADLPIIELPLARFPAWQCFVKRALDIIVSLVALVLLLPAWLVIVWLVRRETGAVAIFRQRRVGYHGAEFTMYKFRTMLPSAEPYAEAPTGPEDERITRTGRWLRKYSLDELPQLLNVLKGDMSLVGPRPEMSFIVAKYEPWQRRRLDVKPGLTGLWQILGRKDLPLLENIQYDFYYIRNWSIWLDLTIILKTAPVVLLGRGAY